MILLSECEITVRRTQEGVRLEAGDDFLDVAAEDVPALHASLKSWAGSTRPGRRFKAMAAPERIAHVAEISLRPRVADICTLPPLRANRREFLDGGLDVVLTAEGVALYLSPAQAERVAAVLHEHQCWLTMPAPPPPR